MPLLNTENLEAQHQELLRDMDIDEEDELRRINERVFGILEQVLDEEERIELNRQIRRPEPSLTSSVMTGFVNTMFVVLLPLVFTRLLLQLLAISTNSNDFSYDLSVYYHSDSFDPSLQNLNMLMKFHFIFASELSSVLSLQYIKFITMFFYVSYSLIMSSYMLFTFVFYFFCIMLTTSRRWNDVLKFIKEVMRSKNGVF